MLSANYFTGTQWCFRHATRAASQALKKYSIETLPVVMEHLEMAQEQYSVLTMGAGRPR